MSTVSQIFVLFYAVFYGAIFTMSDRWRPFFVSHTAHHGWKKLAFSLVFLGLFPVGYFVIVLPLFLPIKDSSWICLFLAVYAVAPIFAFNFFWTWIVVSKRNIFYSQQEQQTEPVKSSLEWVGKSPLVFKGYLFFVAVFILVPSVLIWLIWRGELCH